MLHRFVVELAATEQFPDPVTARSCDLAEALFGPRPVAEAVVAEVDGAAVGFAVFYPTYSTTLGRAGLHLEDLYVREKHRGSGVGRRLLGYVAAETVARGYARLEWWVLHTNVAALRFYARLGARTVDEVAVLRLVGEPLRELALSGQSPC